MHVRNETEKVCFVVNPRAAGGDTGRRLDTLRTAAGRWFVHFDVRATEGPGHATALAAAAVEEGFDVVVAVGGDGTANEVVNGLFVDDVPRGSGTVFAVVPAGTGSDLVRSLGTPRDLDRAMEVAARGLTLETDVVAVSCVAEADGSPVRRLCLNVSGFGANGEVVLRANRSTKRLGGTLTFLGATAAALLDYVPPEVRIQWTGEDGSAGSWEGRLLSAFVANGHYCGGGMWVGRGGSMQDGVLELTILPELHLGRALLEAPRLFLGTVGGLRGTIVARVREIRAEAGTSRVRVDVDGEQPGVLPAVATVMPKTLRVRGVWAGAV